MPSLIGTLAGVAAVGAVMTTWNDMSHNRDDRLAYQDTVDALLSVRTSVARWQSTDRADDDVAEFVSLGMVAADVRTELESLLDTHLSADGRYKESSYERSFQSLGGAADGCSDNDGRDFHLISGVAHGAGSTMALAWQCGGDEIEVHAIGWWSGDHRLFVQAAIPGVEIGGLRVVGTTRTFTDDDCDTDDDMTDDEARCIGSVYITLRHVSRNLTMAGSARTYLAEDADSEAIERITPLEFQPVPAQAGQPLTQCPGRDGEMGWSLIGVPLRCRDGWWHPAIIGEPYCRDSRLTADDPRYNVHAPNYRPIVIMGSTWSDTPGTGDPDPTRVSPTAASRTMRTFATEVPGGGVCPDGFGTPTADNLCVMNITDDEFDPKTLCETPVNANGLGGIWQPFFAGKARTCGNDHTCTTPKVNPFWGDPADASDDVYVPCRYRKHRYGPFGHKKKWCRLRSSEGEVPRRPLCRNVGTILS